MSRIYLFLILLYPFMLPAQMTDCNYSLSGQVIDEHDHSPLAYATILVKEANKSAMGDSLGFYSITGLCKGEYTVVCNHIGCEPVQLKVRIRGNTVQNFF